MLKKIAQRILAKLESCGSHAISAAVVSYFTAASSSSSLFCHSLILLHSPAPCFADLSVLAQWQYTTAHSCTMREGEKEQNRVHTWKRTTILLLGCHEKKKTLLGNNCASSIKYQTSGFSGKKKKKMKLSPLFSGASFPMKLRDSHEKICSHIEPIEEEEEKKLTQRKTDSRGIFTDLVNLHRGILITSY